VHPRRRAAGTEAYQDPPAPPSNQLAGASVWIPEVIFAADCLLNQSRYVQAELPSARISTSEAALFSGGATEVKGVTHAYTTPVGKREYKVLDITRWMIPPELRIPAVIPEVILLFTSEVIYGCTAALYRLQGPPAENALSLLGQRRHAQRELV